MKSGHRNRDKNELNIQLDVCAHCGSNILRGAMRCVSCGKILKTPEEQSDAIREMVKGQNGFKLRRILKLIIFFILAGAVYYFYADGLREFVSTLLVR
jgi:uncharacterized membrane protein YvbJ